MPKTRLEIHDQESHSKEKCPFCARNLEKAELDLHKINCQAKPQPCLYCGGHFDLLELINHEDSCGNRTDPCEICNKYVPKKSMEEHYVYCIQIMCGLDRKPNKRPAKSSDTGPSKRPKLDNP